jgi:hypothetical protein
MSRFLDSQPFGNLLCFLYQVTGQSEKYFSAGFVGRASLRPVGITGFWQVVAWRNRCDGQSNISQKHGPDMFSRLHVGYNFIIRLCYSVSMFSLIPFRTVFLFLFHLTTVYIVLLRSHYCVSKLEPNSVMLAMHLHTQWTTKYNLTAVTITDTLFVLVLNTFTDIS